MEHEMNLARMPLPEYSRQAIANNMGVVSEDSLQELLSKGIGRYMECELLIGTQGMERREGILINVGNSYFVLYDLAMDRSMVCDLFSLRFATFHRAGNAPLQERYQVQMQASPGFTAAFPATSTPQEAYTIPGPAWKEGRHWSPYGCRQQQ